MPRKKKRIIDSIEGGESIIPPVLKESISNCLAKLPQDFYLMLAKEPKQQAKWQHEKQFFGRVGQVIDAYFTGDAPPDFAGVPKREQDEVELEVWRFLSFYSMVAANWKAVRKAIEKESCPSIPILSEYEAEFTAEGKQAKPVVAHFSIPECKFSRLNTPGDVLIKAMEYSAIRQMDFYFGGSQKKPATDYSQRKLIGDVQNSRRVNASGLLVQRIEETLSERYEADPCSHLETICFLASYNNGKKGRARETTKSYLKAGYERESFEKKELHPQTKNRRHLRSS